MNVIEPVEIVLDKPRKLRPTHYALMSAERELNRQRNATPSNAASIDFAIIKAYNETLFGVGSYPLDLTVCLLWAFLLPDDGNLTIRQAAELIDQANITRGELNDALWRAYRSVAGKSISEAAPGEEKKTEAPDPPIGSGTAPLQ